MNPVRAASQTLPLLMLLLSCPAQAGPSLALQAAGPEAAGLTACIGARLSAAGLGLEPAQRLASGLDARITLHPLTPPVASVALSLKPTPELWASHHDDDPEAHPDIVARLQNRLRIPLAIKAWSLAPDASGPCREIAEWLDQTARRPVLLDRLPD